MRNFLASFKAVLDKITYLAGCFAGFLIFCCGIMISYEVVVRGLFNTPTEWVMELSTYCVTIAGFLGMGVTYGAKKHIHVDILLSKLSKTQCSYLAIITTFIGAAYSFIFFVKGAEMVHQSFVMNNCAASTLGTPLWIPQLSMPVGMGILFLHTLYDFLYNASGCARSDEEVAK